MANEADLTIIKMAIAASGRTKKHLAETIGMTPSSFSRCLSGKRNFGRAALKSLSRELNLDAKSLVKDAA